MSKYLYCLIFLFIYKNSFAQDYAARINKHREEYKAEFVADSHSPLKAEDIPFLHFYEPDETYSVQAKFTPAVNAQPFAMSTVSGVTKQYIKYGTLSFALNGKPYTLTVYQGVELIKNPEYKDYLFVPFKDFTNGVESYGGGRYLDFRTGQIKDNVLTLDFNLAYNPYCAYKGGYSCPIPPEENHLQAEIKAGELKFGKDH